MQDSDFSEFAAGRWTTLVRSAVLMGAGLHEAEDLAQQTLLSCYTAWRRVQNADHQDAYVARILLNEFRRSRRRRWTGEVPSAELPDRPTSDHADAVASAAAVTRSLDRLNEGQRVAVVLRYYLQLSERQIAEALRVAPGTVKSRLSRALKVLALDADMRQLDDVSGIDERQRP